MSSLIEKAALRLEQLRQAGVDTAALENAAPRGKPVAAPDVAEPTATAARETVRPVALQQYHAQRRMPVGGRRRERHGVGIVQFFFGCLMQPCVEKGKWFIFCGKVTAC